MKRKYTVILGWRRAIPDLEIDRTFYFASTMVMDCHPLPQLIDAAKHEVSLRIAPGSPEAGRVYLDLVPIMVLENKHGGENDTDVMWTSRIFEESLKLP